MTELTGRNFDFQGWAAPGMEGLHGIVFCTAIRNYRAAVVGVTRYGGF
ncbi:MAG: hypothetical protein ACI9R3_001684 [Verrucomicrobiales bacterium]|jgi:hypothetical protein